MTVAKMPNRLGCLNLSAASTPVSSSELMGILDAEINNSDGGVQTPHGRPGLSFQFLALALLKPSLLIVFMEGTCG